MCQVAADRIARIAAATGRPGQADRWRRLADTIRTGLLGQAWDPSAGHLTEHLGQPGTVDASLLALPLRRVLPADDPRMMATVDAVVERLGASGDLLYRYLPEEGSSIFNIGAVMGITALALPAVFRSMLPRPSPGDVPERMIQVMSRCRICTRTPEPVRPRTDVLRHDFARGPDRIGGRMSPRAAADAALTRIAVTCGVVDAAV